MAKKKTNKRNRLLIVVDLLLAALITVMILAALIILPGRQTNPQLSATQPTTLMTEAPTEETTEPETEPPTTLPPEPEHVVATATIGATGDVLMHLPVVNSGRQSDGSYDFESIFHYLSPYSASVDYAIANLETTLAGTEGGYAYSGYPMFNCPDEIVDGAMGAGFDMFLTANNHCIDTRMYGYQRTLDVVRGKGMEALGTMKTPEDPKWSIQDLNGIKVGMMCYTYQTPTPQGGNPNRVYLNGLLMDEGGDQIINSFKPTNPEPFYEEVAQFMEEMKEAGAEATVMFIHWGEEYVFNPVPTQTAIAQQLCELGIDVIVGGHPHVVEPIQLLTSEENPDHKTVCLYSMGNAVSNQRQGNLSMVSTAHTEDGVWFTMTFSKYSDDTVYLEDVNLIPTWVDLRTTNGRTYNILPLDEADRDNWQENLGLTDWTLNLAGKSFDRTMKLVGDGLAESKEYLASAKAQREADYQAEVDAWIAEHAA